MLYTCCNSSRNTCQRSCGCGFTNTANTTNANGCGCGCGWVNTANTTQRNCCGCGWGNTTNTTNNGWGSNWSVNGVYGVFFPIANRTYCVRQTNTLACGNAGAWTNGCGCGCRRNLCTTNSSVAVINGDAYYARQYGLNTDGCGCGCHSHTGFNGFSADN